MKRLITIALSGSVLLLSLTSCGFLQKEGQKWKMYVAVTGNNLQGVREVLRQEPDLDLGKLGYSESTPFRIKDERALAIAFSGSDDRVIQELLEKGNVEIEQEKEDDWFYLTEAVCNRSLSVTEALIKRGSSANMGEEPALEEFLAFVHPGVADAKRRAQCLLAAGAEVSDKLMHAVLNNEWRYWYAPPMLEWLTSQKISSGESPALEAAIRGEDQILQKSVQEGRVPEKDKKDVTLFAAAFCNVKTLETMRKEGYSFHIRDDYGMTPLHIAALCNSKEAVEFFLEQGLDPEKKATESRYKAVTYAAIGGKQENLNLLMQGRERLPKWTWSAACSFGSRESVQCLLAEGYQPTEWDCYSAYTDCTESVFQELLKRDIPYDVKNQGDGVLEEASEAHVERLLAEGAKPTVTTLERAIEWRNDALIRQIVKELKTQKVDLSTKGCSALENAIAIGDLKSVRYLVKQGVAINAMIADVDCDYTPMHVAAQSPSVDILKLLIENGGDIQIKDGDGKTPYDYAKEMELKDNMELLKP